MATEHFLINPPKRLSRRRRNPVGETLVTIGANPMRTNPWFGHSAGHRKAALIRWGKLTTKRRRKRSAPKVSVRRKKAVVRHVVKRRRAVDRRTKAYKSYALGQQKQLAGFLGLTSGRKPKFRWKSGQGWVKRKSNPIGRYGMARRRKRNTWFGEPRRHRKAALKGWRRGHKIGRKRIKHYRRNPGEYGVNPKRRQRSIRRRHNPMVDLKRFTGGLMDIRSWGPLAITGGISAVTGAVVPGMIGLVNPWAKIGAQLVVAVGGGLAVEKVVDHRHGQAWMIVGVSMVGYQLIKQYLLMPYLPQFAVGLGEEGEYSDYTTRDVSQEIGAFPGEVGAFPQGISGYPGVGAESEAVGAYPYDGSSY